MTVWNPFVTSVKHSCFYSCWLWWGVSGVSWKLCSWFHGCVPKWEPKVSLKDPPCHSGDFLCPWPRCILNTWARLKRNYSTDYFSPTPGDNEVKIAYELCREQKRRWEEPHEVLAVTSAVYAGSEHRLTAFWVQATRQQLTMKRAALEETSTHRCMCVI